MQEAKTRYFDRPKALTGHFDKNKKIILYNSAFLWYNIISNCTEANVLAVKLNPDEKIVNVIKEGLKRTGGYCPCRTARTEEFKCMCKEFREQIADPDFEGFCHCMLYYKSKEEK